MKKIILWVGALICASVLSSCRDHAPVNNLKANISLNEQCVGRMEISFPSTAITTWSQEIGVFSVEREHEIASRADFLEKIESRKRELQVPGHDSEGSLLSDVYEDVDGTSILLFRSSPADTYTYLVEAYAWLDMNGYKLKSTVATEERSQVPSLLAFVKDLKPLVSDRMPSGNDFCFDGAYLTSPRQRVSALMQAPMPGWQEARAWVSVLGNESVQVEGAGDIRYDLERERNAAKSILADDPGAATDPLYPKRFDVLRSQRRALNAIAGQEFIWKKELNNGVKVYNLRWQTDSEPNGATIGMDVGNEDNPVPTPDESEILAVWDAIVSTLRYR